MDEQHVRDDVPFTVVAKRHRSPVIVQLTLRPATEQLDYRPGQYVLLSDVDYERPPRSYSIANAPRRDGSLDILVTLVPGGVTSPWLHHGVSPGDHVLLSGPYGTFIDDLDQRGPRLYLAGGSGLAPVRALAEAALQHPNQSEATLLFSARTVNDLIDDALFRHWTLERPAFRYLRTLTRAPGPSPVGHISDVLPDLLPRLENHRVFISGGSGFVAACDRVVRRQGASPGRVFTEEFFVDPRPWRGIGTKHDGDV